MTCLSRPPELRTRIAASAIGAGLAAFVMAYTIVQGAGAETSGQQAMIPPHVVLEPIRTDTNIIGIVIACEHSGQVPVLQLQVYSRDGERLLPDRRAGAAPKAEPGASIVLDDRPFRSNLLFADRYAVVDDRTGPVAGLSDELVAALLQARTMVLQFDLLEEEAGRPPRFDSETTIHLDVTERAAIRRVAHCVDPRVSA